MPRNEKVQFNVRIPDRLAKRLKADAVRSNRSLDVVASTIFGDFLDSWSVSERARYYSGNPPKREGRPIKEAA